MRVSIDCLKEVPINLFSFDPKGYGIIFWIKGLIGIMISFPDKDNTIINPPV
jgi:hypothetical protein